MLIDRERTPLVIRKFGLIILVSLVGVVSSIGLFGVRLIEEKELRSALEQQRSEILSEATGFRENVLGEMNSAFSLVRSIAYSVGTSPRLSRAEFELLASGVVLEVPEILRLEMVRNSSAKFLYPVGEADVTYRLKRRDESEYRHAVGRVRNSERAIMSESIQLDDGRFVYVCDFPINVLDNGKVYFDGVVSAWLDVERLYLKNGRINILKGVDVVFSEKGISGTRSGLIVGNPSLSNADPVELSCYLLSSVWKFSFVPSGGWISEAPKPTWIRFAVWGGVVLLIIVFSFVYLYLSALEKTKYEVRQANLAKTYFLANMSHEIRTPLNGIIGAAQVVKLSSLNEDQRKWIDVVISSGRLLTNLLGDVLDLSKIEAGTLEIDMKSFALDPFMKDLLESLSMTAKQGGVRLLYGGIPSGVERIVLDEVRLRQVLRNLLSNSIKFSPEGEVRIGVKLLSDESKSKNKLRFIVTDTGVGIKKERQKEIFDNFVQEDSSTTRSFEGCGIGLAIAKNVVDQLGGEIRLESVKGKGSQFEVTLPIQHDRETRGNG